MQLGRITSAVQRFLFGIALLASVIAFFYLFENWRGQRSWERFLREMQVRGEQLDWRAFVAEAVPDEDNFIATPLLDAIGYKGETNSLVWAKFENNPLAGYSFDCTRWKAGEVLDLLTCQAFLRGAPVEELRNDRAQAAAEILQSFASLDPEFLELREASRRRFAQFRVSGPEGDLPKFAVLRKLAYLLALRTSAALAVHNSGDAYADAYVIQRLAMALQAEPYLVGTMIGCATIGSMGLQTFWEGLSSGQWTDAHLRQFQTFFEGVNLLGSFDRAMHGGERAGLNDLVQRQTRRGLHEVFSLGSGSSGLPAILERAYYSAWPRGWVYQNLVFHHRLLDKTAFSNYDVAAQRVYPEKCRENNKALQQSINSWNPYAQLAAVGIPNFMKALEVVASTQTSVNQAALACALERYRRAHHQYPSSLAALVPEFIEKRPHDLITGNALQYQRVGGQTYLLYSVGWDGMDNGGLTEAPGSSAPSDWRWPPGVR